MSYLKSQFQIPWIDNVLNELSVTERIFRIIKIEHLEQMLNDNVSWFASPYKWPDQFDSLFLRSKAILSNGKDPVLIASHGYSDNYFCQCWCKKEGESDAMWRIYSPSNENVMIVSTVDKVFDSIWNTEDEFIDINTFCGQVKYVRKWEIENKRYYVDSIANPMIPDSNGTNIAKSILVKLDAYKHEEEVRFIVRNETVKHVGNKGILLPHVKPIKDIIDMIIIDPRNKGDSIQKVQALTTKFNFNPVVKSSDLYSSPNLQFYV